MGGRVATGVLHNVGNVLNSVNVSAGPRRGKASPIQGAEAGKGRGTSHLPIMADLGEYLTNDANGQKLPGYLSKSRRILYLGKYRTTERGRSTKP